MNSAFVYWERQRSDQLCAVHCINSLLQGPFVTEIDLGQIGQAIDQEEQSVSLRSRSSGQNVSLEGYFSIQVIMRALTYHGVSLNYLDQTRFQSGAADPTKETGLVFNRSHHWQTYRKVRNVWYDLNSLRHLPSIISEFSLSSHIEAMISTGYTVFVAQGQFPNTDKLRNPAVQSWQQWVSERTIQEVGRSPDSEGWETDPEEERLLKKAIEDSKRDARPHVPRTTGSIEDPELAAAIALSLQSENVQQKPHLPHIEIGPEPIDPTAFPVKVKFPDGISRTRKFLPSDKVLVVMLWVQSMANLEVTMTFPYPRKILDVNSTLSQSEVTPNSNYLIAEHLRHPT